MRMSETNETAVRELIKTADIETLRKVWLALAKAIKAENGTPVTALRAEAIRYGEDPVSATFRLLNHVRDLFYKSVKTNRKAWQMGAFGERHFGPVYDVDCSRAETVFADALKAVRS